MIEAVLKDWNDYDAKKNKNSDNIDLFCCDEAWEIFYLKNKIHKEFPFIAEIKILEAIESCCSNGQKQRKEFVQRVMTRLGIA
jgi:hypothetical protein